jgi:hypothetical protein
VQEFSFGSGNQSKCAELLLTSIRNRRVKVWPDESLADEMTTLVVREMSYGWRVDHQPGKHNDRAVCVMMALWACAERLITAEVFTRDTGFRLGGRR